MSKTGEDAYHKIRAAASTAPSGCPIDHDFTPFNEHYLRDPYPERLSAQQVLHYSPNTSAARPSAAICSNWPGFVTDAW